MAQMTWAKIALEIKSLQKEIKNKDRHLKRLNRSS